MGSDTITTSGLRSETRVSRLRQDSLTSRTGFNAPTSVFKSRSLYRVIPISRSLPATRQESRPVTANRLRLSTVPVQRYAPVTIYKPTTRTRLNTATTQLLKTVPVQRTFTGTPRPIGSGIYGSPIISTTKIMPPPKFGFNFGSGYGSGLGQRSSRRKLRVSRSLFEI
jgi:hypothetical protein